MNSEFILDYKCELIVHYRYLNELNHVFRYRFLFVLSNNYSHRIRLEILTFRNTCFDFYQVYFLFR